MWTFTSKETITTKTKTNFVGGEPGDLDSKDANPEDPITESTVASVDPPEPGIRDQMLRIAADFENYKKRTKNEMSDLAVRVRENVLRDILEVMDNLERAANADVSSNPKAVQEGIALVLRLFQSKLERYDIKPFASQGRPFDPRIHDAVSQLPTTEVPPGSVLNELQKGYHVGERLLRPALVTVAMAPATMTTADMAPDTEKK